MRLSDYQGNTAIKNRFLVQVGHRLRPAALLPCSLRMRRSNRVYLTIGDLSMRDLAVLYG